MVVTGVPFAGGGAGVYTPPRTVEWSHLIVSHFTHPLFTLSFHPPPHTARYTTCAHAIVVSCVCVQYVCVSWSNHYACKEDKLGRRSGKDERKVRKNGKRNIIIELPG